MSIYIGIPQHPSEYVMVWCTARKAYLKVINNRCDFCHELVDISNPATYYLERFLGNSDYGYQIHHTTAHCSGDIQASIDDIRSSVIVCECIFEDTICDECSKKTTNTTE